MHTSCNFLETMLNIHTSFCNLSISIYFIDFLEMFMDKMLKMLNALCIVYLISSDTVLRIYTTKSPTGGLWLHECKLYPKNISYKLPIHSLTNFERLFWDCHLASYQPPITMKNQHYTVYVICKLKILSVRLYQGYLYLLLCELICKAKYTVELQIDTSLPGNGFWVNV